MYGGTKKRLERAHRIVARRGAFDHRRVIAAVVMVVRLATMRRPSRGTWLAPRFFSKASGAEADLRSRATRRSCRSTSGWEMAAHRHESSTSATPSVDELGSANDRQTSAI